MDIRRLPEPVRKPLRWLRMATPKQIARWTRNATLDLVDKLKGRGDPMVPPRNLAFIGDGDYRAVGEHFLKLFVEVGGLKPDQDVLDVGAGTGRIALPLTAFLSKDADYRGIEITRPFVDWCTAQITSRHPNFQFIHADLWNKMYNPGGKVQSHDYRFPFEDASYDFAFATSVFTHMYPRDVQHYLSEIARVLRPGGTCFATFFLLTSGSRERIARGEGNQPFSHELDGCWTTTPKIPESAIAFAEGDVLEMLKKAGLQAEGLVHHGSWSGLAGAPSYQDIVVARKKRTS